MWRYISRRKFQYEYCRVKNIEAIDKIFDPKNAVNGGGMMTEKYLFPTKVGMKLKDFEGIHAPAFQKQIQFLGSN